jgi:hypothetical protein
MNTINEPIEPLDPDDVHPLTCNELWSAVIARTFKDADWSPIGEKATSIAPDLYQEFFNARAYALSWLRGTTEGFALICDAANVNPGYVRRIARHRYGALLDESWTPIELSEALRLSGVGSKPEKETVA